MKKYLFQNGKFYYGWIIVMIGLFMMLLGYVSLVSVTSVFVIPVTEALGIDRATFVLYQTIVQLSSVAAAAYYGKRMAKGNIKKIMAICAIASGIAYIAFGLATNVWFFYIFGIVLGIGFACVTTMPLSILINNWFGGKIKGTAMGMSFIGSGLGGIILIPLLNSIITAFNWRMAYFLLAAFFLLIITPIILLFVVKTPEEKGFTRMGQNEGEKDASEAEGLTFKEAVKTPTLWMVALSITIFTVSSGAILFNAAPYYIESGFSTAQAATFASFNIGCLAIGKIVIGILSDRLGTAFGAVFSCAVFTGCFFFLYLLPLNPNLFIIGVILCYGIGGGGITVCPPLMVNALFGEKDYGNIIAIFTMANNFGGAFGGTIAALVYDMTGSYRTFWVFATLSLLVSVTLRVVSFCIRKRYFFSEAERIKLENKRNRKATANA